MNKKIIIYYLAIAFTVFAGVSSFIILSFNIYLLAFGSGPIWVFLGALLFYLFTQIPQFQSVGSWLARVVSFWRKAEIASVSLAIESELNSVQEDLNRQSAGLVPFPAKVEWVMDQDAESFCDTFNGKVIIRMKEHAYNARNIAWATLDYVSKGMIPYSRLYLDDEMSRGIDYTIGKKILLENEGALDYFYREVIVPDMADGHLRETMQMLENLDNRGILTRIFLEEVKDLGLELYPNLDSVAVTETREFAQNLNVYATRTPGQRDGKPYVGTRIKVGLVLIAEVAKLSYEGATPYLAWAGACVANGAKSIYILSRKEKNIPAAALADQIARQFNLEIKKIDSYDEIVNDEAKKALCLKLTPKTRARVAV